MPWEHSADGLIKHLVHQKLNTREMCVEAYMQFLKAGEKSGVHRHMWEEIIFVVEGSGYDLHWDLKWDCLEAFQWEWAAEPKAYSWKRGDYIYIPPFTNHQHVAGDHEECRLIVMSNRITKEMGFDWFDQVENAPGYDAKMKNGGGTVVQTSPRHSGRREAASPESITPVRMTWILRVIGFQVRALSARPGMTLCRYSSLRVSRRAAPSQSPKHRR